MRASLNTYMWFCMYIVHSLTQVDIGDAIWEKGRWCEVGKDVMHISALKGFFTCFYLYLLSLVSLTHFHFYLLRLWLHTWPENVIYNHLWIYEIYEEIVKMTFLYFSLIWNSVHVIHTHTWKKKDFCGGDGYFGQKKIGGKSA